jgi:hypothetical protein
MDHTSPDLGNPSNLNSIVQAIALHMAFSELTEEAGQEFVVPPGSLKLSRR